MSAPEVLDSDIFKAVRVETADLVQCFKGHEIYLVGGGVRDLLRGKDLEDLTDLDLCTSARPKKIKKLIAPVAENVWAVGERFGTIGCTYKGRTYEITTFRKEVYEAGTRKPQVEFGTDVLEDLQRRDFTVNAIALRLIDGEVFDPHNGRQDLKAKLLRTPIQPEILFTEDPLRILRAARFEVQLELTPVPEILLAMKKMVDRLDIVSRERKLEELRRLLCLPDPTTGIARLAEMDLLGKIILIPSAPRVFPADGLTKLKGLQPNFQLRMAGLLLMIGGDYIKAIDELPLSKEDSRAIKKFIESFKDFEQKPNPTIKDARNLATQLSSQENWKQFQQLLPPKLSATFSELFDELSQEQDLFNPTPLLTSQEIMEALGLKPGPQVGKAQKALEEIYLAKGRLSKEQAIFELIKKLS